jgi:hypothetical protein
MDETWLATGTVANMVLSDAGHLLESRYMMGNLLAEGHRAGFVLALGRQDEGAMGTAFGLSSDNYIPYWPKWRHAFNPNS